ncbi:MAG TPA: hypothetical protein VMM55_12445 [Thermohalobaculum sp.]|nr:hypothetical protein [Thermohalobaculum sp.]
MTRTEQNEISPVSARPMVTPELVDYYVREGRRMRARALRQMARQIGTAVAARLGRRRRMGRLTPSGAS